MAAINFPVITVALNGGDPVRLDIIVADMYRFETLTGKTLIGKDGNFGFAQLIPLTWLAAKRLKLVAPEMSVDEFADAITDMDIDDATTDAGLDPTKSTTNPSTT